MVDKRPPEIAPQSSDHQWEGTVLGLDGEKLPKLPLETFGIPMKLLQEQAGHTCDASFAGVGPTVQFMDTAHRWFVLMDVSNCTQHIHQKNADCKQFESAGDERLIWLETSFLDYLADLKRSQQDENITPHCLPFIPSPLYIMNKHQCNLRIYFTAPSLIRAQVSLHKHARNSVVASSAQGLGMGWQRGVVASA
ncbi:hypothetical protein HPB49_002396 [Dermacentor silvarum]|uniref:Uncharacterized protein n=1 Tax=Dermacentor silvarum TaxID=543639 RepID=A0ACB8CCV9_DERSI|nr:hypothetical protein HPB49_002396 [Dermacentor silvarum]